MYSVGHCALRSVLEEINQIGWGDFAGYRRQEIIMAAVKGDAIPPEESAQIERWADFQRRLDRQGKGDPILVVHRFHPCCTNPSCGNAYMLVPKLHPLQNLMPYICPACGTALVPAMLNDVMESHG